MRILYIVHQYFPKFYTGTERFVLNTAHQMQKMGHYVEVLTYGHEDTIGFSILEGALYKRYSFENIPVISVRHLQPPEDISFVFDIFDDKLESLLSKFITKENYDVVHIAHSVRMGIAIKVAMSNGLPLVLTLTDFWMMCPRGIAINPTGELCHDPEGGAKCIRDCFGDLWKDKIIQRRDIIKEILRKTDKVVCATYFSKYIFEKNYPFLDIAIIPFGENYCNIIPNNRVYSSDCEIVLGFMSTLQPHKGAHILLEAFAKANIDNFRIKIYGHYFQSVDYYKQLIKEYDNKKIEFCGQYRYEDMSTIFNDIDILVVPSLWWENSPLVLLRALAHNVPAIVSNLGGLTAIIEEGVNGFTFEVGNPESLKKVLIKIGKNTTILNSLKSNIRHPSRIEEQAFEYEKIYLGLPNNKL